MTSRSSAARESRTAPLPGVERAPAARSERGVDGSDNACTAETSRCRGVPEGGRGFVLLLGPAWSASSRVRTPLTRDAHGVRGLAPAAFRTLSEHQPTGPMATSGGRPRAGGRTSRRSMFDNLPIRRPESKVPQAPKPPRTHIEAFSPHAPLGGARCWVLGNEPYMYRSNGLGDADERFKGSGRLAGSCRGRPSLCSASRPRRSRRPWPCRHGGPGHR